LAQHAGVTHEGARFRDRGAAVSAECDRERAGRGLASVEMDPSRPGDRSGLREGVIFDRKHVLILSRSWIGRRGREGTTGGELRVLGSRKPRRPGHLRLRDSGPCPDPNELESAPAARRCDGTHLDT